MQFEEFREEHPASKTANIALGILGFGIFSVSVSAGLAQFCYLLSLSIGIYILLQFPLTLFPKRIVTISLVLSLLSLLGYIFAPGSEVVEKSIGTFIRMQAIGVIAVFLLQISQTLKGFMLGSVAGGTIAAVSQLINAKSRIVDVGRSAAGIIDLNEYGTMAAILVCFVLFVPLQKTRWTFFVRLLLVALLSASLLSTASRSSTALLVVALVFHFCYNVYLQIKRKPKELGAIFLLPVVLLFGLYAITKADSQLQQTASRISTLGDTISSGGNGRLAAQKASIGLIEESPILGYGINATGDLIEDMGVVGRGMVSHNTFIELSVGMGLSGLFCTLFLVGQGIWSLLNFRSYEARVLLLTILILYASAMTLGLQIKPHFWVLLYLSSAYVNVISKSPTRWRAARIHAKSVIQA